jgi:hypothetical protein
VCFFRPRGGGAVFVFFHGGAPPPPPPPPPCPVVEIWSPIYGPCDSIKPFVGPLMQKLEYDTSVQWPVVSIHKLEAEAIAEKKKGMRARG